MKKYILFTILITLVFTVNLSAQTSAKVTNTAASADLLVAMTLAQTSPLSFGSSVLTTSAGGTVLLPSNSTTRVYTGGIVTSAATPAYN